MTLALSAALAFAQSGLPGKKLSVSKPEYTNSYGNNAVEFKATERGLCGCPLYEHTIWRKRVSVVLFCLAVLARAGDWGG